MNPSAQLSVAPTSTGVSSPRFLELALRIVALTVLFCGAAVYSSYRLSALDNFDVWMHLRTGTWILQNQAIPRTGLFSQYSSLVWNDSSWAFDMLVGALYNVFGLRGIPILLIALKTALAVVTFLLARRLGADFWRAVVLSAVVQYVISGLAPAPYVFSILFFAIELQLLVRSRQTGAVRNLVWLPLLFVMWANLHLQFVAGLVLLGLFLISLSVEQALRGLGVSRISERVLPLPLVKVSAIALLSLLGTLLTPYTLHLLPNALKSFYSDVAFEYFLEMSSMSFRRPQEFLLMLLVMAGFLALGRQRSLRLFETVALVAGTLVAFRIQRDGWMAVLPAIAAVSSGYPLRTVEEVSPGKVIWPRAWVAGLTTLVLLIAVLRLPGQNALMSRIGQNSPVKACDYIRDHNLSQPIFNPYAWGSFLAWYLPQYPVVADSRVELYGDDLLGKYFRIISGKELLESDPTVARAGTLLLERNSAMAKALTNLPALSAQYRLVYSDDMASVFVPTK